MYSQILIRFVVQPLYAELHTPCFVVLQLPVESGVGASRGPRLLHLAVRIAERQPLPPHQVANHHGGGARHAGVTVDQDHAALRKEKIINLLCHCKYCIFIFI